MRLLITGITGSLGTALLEHYLANTGYRIIGYSRDEWKQAQLRERFPTDRLDLFLGDVRDLRRLELAFAAADAVIHTAALKRVDAGSYNPSEILQTNVFGSENVLRAALGRVPKCLLISSDKACYPTNIYGASKMMAEHLFTSYNAYSIPRGTASACVRYGNVMGSRGSVIPLWRQQIAEGKPLSLTHPEMTRFLITFPRAIQLIEDALESMEGGEIFIPRLKAASMIDLANVLKPESPPWPWLVTGLRPGGEKLHETLMTEEEIQRAGLAVPDTAIIPPEMSPWRDGIKMIGLSVPEQEWRSDTAPRYSLEELKELCQNV